MNARRFSIAALLLSAAACDPQKSDWGLDAIRTMVTPADDPALGCGVVQIPADPAAAARTACQFPPGARAPWRRWSIDESVQRAVPDPARRPHDEGEPELRSPARAAA